MSRPLWLLRQNVFWLPICEPWWWVSRAVSPRCCREYWPDPAVSEDQDRKELLLWPASQHQYASTSSPLLNLWRNLWSIALYFVLCIFRCSVHLFMHELLNYFSCVWGWAITTCSYVTGCLYSPVSSFTSRGWRITVPTKLLLLQKLPDSWA